MSLYICLALFMIYLAFDIQRGDAHLTLSECLYYRGSTRDFLDQYAQCTTIILVNMNTLDGIHTPRKSKSHCMVSYIHL